MQTINIKDFHQYLGELIDLEDSETYNDKHIPGAINIPYETLLYNKDKLLNKNKVYYLYCHGGYKSRKAVNMLLAYGYNVIQVLIN